ncbi:FAD-binding oxidoreductase [Actinomadura sp. WMMB 499]|uniref:FAD-binding oxidoreductase n=1 Tax=Actinomadura sp. WMMB 499 TaxID=1219491 RepID=UPI001246138F|nr:FAD-binding oxidoreductase [Actinomadura sp. WMMB 499]QFG23968.1 FAD-binding oxidoreductase [Actinomadura sp. WMMB 499]
MTFENIRGRVLLPGDAGFDDARRPWNLAVDQPVAAVVEAADAADVAALVRHARASGRTITTQPSGHGATGRTEDAILLRTGRLDGLRVDPSTRTARAGAGVNWGRVQAAAAPHGLTGLPGSSPVVSVTGYTLGGGLGWFGRAHGWAADSVTAFDVVDAGGAARRVTPAGDPDLFWALRGGGGDFAIVTAVEFALHPAPALYGGRVLWSGDRLPEVMDAYRELTAAAPDHVTAWLDVLHFPGSDPLVAIDVTVLGDARDLLRPLDAIPGALSDGRRPMSPADLGTITAEPTAPGAGLSRGELLTDLDDGTVKTLLSDPIAPLMSLQIRHLGGAFGRPSDTPHGPLTEPYALYLFGVPTGPESSAAITAKQRALAGALGPHLSGRKPFTYLNAAETAADAFGPAALGRLRDIKRTRDPHGVFRSNFPVLADG